MMATAMQSLVVCMLIVASHLVLGEQFARETYYSDSNCQTTTGQSVFKVDSAGTCTTAMCAQVDTKTWVKRECSTQSFAINLNNNNGLFNMYSGSSCGGSIVGTMAVINQPNQCDAFTQCCNATGPQGPFTRSQCAVNGDAIVYICQDSACSQCDSGTVGGCYILPSSDSVTYSWLAKCNIYERDTFYTDANCTVTARNGQAIYRVSRLGNCTNQQCVATQPTGYVKRECALTSWNFTVRTTNQYELFEGTGCTGDRVGTMGTIKTGNFCDPFNECCEVDGDFTTSECSQSGIPIVYVCNDKNCNNCDGGTPGGCNNLPALDTVVYSWQATCKNNGYSLAVSVLLMAACALLVL